MPGFSHAWAHNVFDNSLPVPSLYCEQKQVSTRAVRLPGHRRPGHVVPTHEMYTCRKQLHIPAASAQEIKHNLRPLLYSWLILFWGPNRNCKPKIARVEKIGSRQLRFRRKAMMPLLFILFHDRWSDVTWLQPRIMLRNAWTRIASKMELMHICFTFSSSDIKEA